MAVMKIISNLLSWLEEKFTTSIAWAESHGSETAANLAANTEQESPDFSLSIQENLNDLLFWSFSSITVVSLVLLVSIIRKFEELLDPALHRIKKFAPFIMQITLGLTLMVSAFYNSLFGVELPLTIAFTEYAELIRIVFAIGGGMLLVGIYPRLVGFGVVAMFVFLILNQGLFMMHYLPHLGEAITIFVLGGTYEVMKSDSPLLPKLYRSLELYLHKYKFLVLRIFFGASLIFSSIYTKYLHGSHALETVANSSLTNMFPFDPTFLVLGFLIVEILLGFFFMIGFEIRFSALAYIVFLIASIIFFQEAIWPHVILIGTCLAMITHGYDRYTIGGTWLKRGNLEPIL